MRTFLKHFKIGLEVMLLLLFVYTIFGLVRGAQRATVDKINSIFRGELTMQSIKRENQKRI